MNITIYHNPRCSKSRQTLELLRQEGAEPEVIEYLQNPPSVAELKTLLNKLKLKPRQLLRTKEAEYKQAGLDDTTLSDEEILRAMVAHPKLIERPIVVKGNKAALGRPPERVLEIL
ncbi:MAG: arsenate reductase [Thiotrichales bacterium SG8_50]|nr:MAG: arsenate reductase [Thiotrichales bacterium SG8_50]